MASNILQLSNLIQDSVVSFVGVCSKNNLRIPELNEPFSPDSETFRSNPDVAKAAKIIAAAAFQLAACVLPPQESIVQTSSGPIKSAALRVSIECHVPEILRDAGPEGMHISAIAMKAGVDETKLARLLRLLANRHIFREVQPDYFVNNRISGILDTGKAVDHILRDPTKKHDGTPGFVATVELMVSNSHRASAYVLENMKDPATAFSGEPNHAPFQRAFGTEKSYYDWYTQPEQAYDRHRFGIAMKGTTALTPPDLILELFDWSSLPNDAIVVDVGGGIGTSGKVVLGTHPHLQFVVQDMPMIVEDGIKHWEKENPAALASGKIKFQAHDFFTSQPITNASIFLLKNIIHNWTTPYNTKILTNLRNSAKPATVLLVLDVVMTYSCRETKQPADECAILEDPIMVAPEVLSTGFNSVTDMVWVSDASMLLYLNTQEYTLAQFKQLFTNCGWRITQVIRTGSSLDSVLAVPI